MPDTIPSPHVPGMRGSSISYTPRWTVVWLINSCCVYAIQKKEHMSCVILPNLLPVTARNVVPTPLNFTTRSSYDPMEPFNLCFPPFKSFSHWSGRSETFDHPQRSAAARFVCNCRNGAITPLPPPPCLSPFLHLVRVSGDRREWGQCMWLVCLNLSICGMFWSISHTWNGLPISRGINCETYKPCSCSYHMLM